MSDFAELFKAKGHGLVLPKDEDDINRYVAMHSGEQDRVERRPFPRQVDFWAFSIATALALKLSPREGPVRGWGKNFIYTSQGIMSDELCALLAVIAVARLGHDDPDVGDPRRIIEMANRLAGAGCPVVLKELTENALRITPLDRALEFARTMQDGLRSEE